MGYGNTSFAGLIPPPTEVNNEHQDYSIFIAIIVTGVVACFAVFARLGNKYVSNGWGSDDYAIIPALVIYIGWTAMASYMTIHSGIGKPLGEITYGEFIHFYQGTMIAIWIYPALSAAIRVSILLFYHRLFSKAEQLYRAIIWILLGLQACYVVAFEVVPAFVCKPVATAWEPIQRLKHCNSSIYIDSTFWLYIISLVFDLILLIFPIFIVWRLQMTSKKRVQVIIIFTLMTCAPIAACYKLVIYKQKARVPHPQIGPGWYEYQASTYIFPQFEQYGTGFWIPTHVEPTVALIGTSIPTMLKVYTAASLQFSKIRSAIVSSLRGSGSSQGSPGGSQRTQHSKYSWKSGRNRTTSSTENKFQQLDDSHIELRPVGSSKNTSLRSDEFITTALGNPSKEDIV